MKSGPWTISIHAGIAGALAGIIPALLTRIAMRWIALDQGGIGEFSPISSGLIVMGGMQLGVFLGLAYHWLGHHLPGEKWPWRALGYVLLLLIPAVPVMMFALNGRVNHTSLLVQIIFYTTPFQYAFLIVGLSALMDTRWPDWPHEPEKSWLKWAVWVFLGLNALMGAMVFVALGFTGGLNGLVENTARNINHLINQRSNLSTLEWIGYSLVFSLLLLGNITLSTAILRRTLPRLKTWAGLMVSGVMILYIWLFAGPAFPSEAFRLSYLRSKGIIALAVLLLGLLSSPVSRHILQEDETQSATSLLWHRRLMGFIGLLGLAWLFYWGM